jgi:carbon-monoxide dehydrogenase medium subunit/2-furoyl-CoA dehydrogenase FAD binding subunit
MAAVFDYRTVSSVPEAVSLLVQYGDDAKVLAGGQSLIPLLNLGLAQPAVLIDINRVRGLSGIERRDGELVLGALTRHAEAEQNAAVRESTPLLAEAYPLIGDRQVRARGTIGGSMAHADPVAELPTVAVCLGATIKVEGKDGARDVSATDFFVTYLTSSLASDELVTEVRFPAMAPGTGFSFQELVRRKGDFAIVAAAATVELDASGVCRNARLALAGVGGTPVGAEVVNDVLQGRAPSPPLLREAAERACEGIEPESDVLASAEYRRAMAVVYARRTLEAATERASRS